MSQVETQQLDQTMALYQQVIKRSITGLPLIAYYPAERFVNDINLLNKIYPALLKPFQPMTLAHYRLQLLHAF